MQDPSEPWSNAWQSDHWWHGSWVERTTYTSAGQCWKLPIWAIMTCAAASLDGLGQHMARDEIAAPNDTVWTWYLGTSIRCRTFWTSQKCKHTYEFKYTWMHPYAVIAELNMLWSTSYPNLQGQHAMFIQTEVWSCWPLCTAYRIKPQDLQNRPLVQWVCWWEACKQTPSFRNLTDQCNLKTQILVGSEINCGSLPSPSQADEVKLHTFNTYYDRHVMFPIVKDSVQQHP